MDYNTKREKLILPEYGRLVQKMAEYAMGIEERDKRQRCAETIVRIMANFSAQNRNTPGLQQKLWDHLAFMTGYKLDVDYPFPIEQRIGSNKPEQVPYPTSKIHFRRTDEARRSKNETESGNLEQGFTERRKNTKRHTTLYG